LDVAAPYRTLFYLSGEDSLELGAWFMATVFAATAD
jgi:hypothetical protein